MQDNWNCKLEQTEWVCRAQDPQEAKEAVIIVAAKEKGPLDNFLLYENHLNGPVSTVGRNGVAMVSTVKYKAQNKKLMIKSGLMACMATVRFKTILPATWQR